MKVPTLRQKSRASLSGNKEEGRRNIKITVEYDGSRYAGWQVQNGHKVATIQEMLESALRKILHTNTKVIVSGRTDAGVHAWAQVANFKTDSAIALERFPLAINAFLPEDIAVTGIEEKSPDFHSRFSARSKVYRYLILNRPYRSALLRDFVLQYPYPLDAGLMRREARVLAGRHDFKAFCASGTRVKDTLRTISRITITRPRSCCLVSLARDIVSIEIEADGFLYTMVRSIVGTLLQVGRHTLAKGGLKRILLSKDRRMAGPAVSGQGLCLVKVRY